MTCLMTRSMQFVLLKAKHLKSPRNRTKLLPTFQNFSFLQSRKTIRHVRSSKVFFIMRGLPGSGKSTLVRAIKSRFKEVVVCSADGFFVQEDGSYAYDSEKLPQAHEECANLAQQAVEMGVRHIVIDNTNILRWEMGKYLKLANDYGYAVIIVEPKTPWNLEPVELAAKNTHGCTVEVVEQKMKKFKPILPIYWGWFFNETVASELLMLAETYFDLCMRKIPEFASYINKFGVSKGLTFPISFKEFYNRPNARLLHCTSFFSGMKNSRSPGTDEYADRLEVQHSMGKAFSMKLVGIMFSPRTVGIRVILNKGQLPLWGAEDVWFPQPPPKPKAEDADRPTDVVMQDAPKVQKQKGRKRHNDNFKDLKRDENDTKSGVAVLMDALDTSESDDTLVFMAPDLSLSDSDLAPESGIKHAQVQTGCKMSTETASCQSDIKIETDQSDSNLVLDQGHSEVSDVQKFSEIVLSENGVKILLNESHNPISVAAESVDTIPETCSFVAGNYRTECSAEEMHDLEAGGSFPCFSCLEISSRSLSSQVHHSNISAYKCCPMHSQSLENIDVPAGQFPSTYHENLSDIFAEYVCQMPVIDEENKSNIPVDKFSLETHSVSLQNYHELIPEKTEEGYLADFFIKNAESDDTQTFSRLNISSRQPLENTTDSSIFLQNSIGCASSDVCTEPDQSKDSTSAAGGSDEVPRIQLKRGSQAHITLGCAEGYAAVQTGYDQMEILLCEDSGAIVNESVVTDDVEITYYGEGRCAVYFDWPIYKSALFTGKY